VVNLIRVDLACACFVGCWYGMAVRLADLYEGARGSSFATRVCFSGGCLSTRGPDSAVRGAQGALELQKVV
jgi:hypothetical protein